MISVFYFFFFFSSRRRHTRLVSDWSSDVCSSDLKEGLAQWRRHLPAVRQRGEQPIGLGLVARRDRQTDSLEHGLAAAIAVGRQQRSEERRVGKECRSRWSPYH